MMGAPDCFTRIAPGARQKPNSSTAQPGHPDGAKGQLDSAPYCFNTGQDGHKPGPPERPRQQPCASAVGAEPGGSPASIPGLVATG
eukprot:8775710-Karenia_brevis.AAC.1